VLARAVERARRVIRCNRLYGREVSDENVAAIVVERERCSMPTAVEATRIVRAEPTAAKE
jgi:phosphopantetheine adenylyltransferase